jgi:hypothetical protein
MPQVIGEIWYTSPTGLLAVIQLRDDFSWIAVQPLARSTEIAAEFLAAHFADYSYSPTDGEPGAKLLADAADFMGGQAVWLAPPPVIRLPCGPTQPTS